MCVKGLCELSVKYPYCTLGICVTMLGMVVYLYLEQKSVYVHLDGCGVLTARDVMNLVNKLLMLQFVVPSQFGEIAYGTTGVRLSSQSYISYYILDMVKFFYLTLAVLFMISGFIFFWVVYGAQQG